MLISILQLLCKKKREKFCQKSEYFEPLAEIFKVFLILSLLTFEKLP